MKALFRRGGVFSKRIDFERADADFQKVLSIDPENAAVKKEIALMKKKME